VSGLPAAGVFLSVNGGGTATLNNNGSIGALSDLAILGDPTVNNNGTITGFVQFTGSNNSIVNAGTFNLRNFVETTGNADGTANNVRDTVRVAVADLGAGTNNTFFNNGTLALPAVAGATTLDSTKQYLPLGNANNAMSLGGPLQGHLIGVTTFTNSGTIDLQSNPVPGDVLVITGARQAGLSINPLIAGGAPPELSSPTAAGYYSTLCSTRAVPPRRSPIR
jgi:autotransporter family porin